MTNKILIAASIALILALLLPGAYPSSPNAAAVSGPIADVALDPDNHDDGDDPDDGDDDRSDVEDQVDNSGPGSDGSGWSPEPVAPAPDPQAPTAATSPFVSTSALTVAEPAAPAPAPAAASALSIQAVNYQFSPASMTITAGDTVMWSNVEGAHTTTSYDGSWDSGMMMTGQTFSFTFASPGVYRYRCLPHAGDGMVGEIVVRAAPAPAPAEGGAGGTVPGEVTVQSGAPEASSPSAPTAASRAANSPQQALPNGGAEPPDGSGLDPLLPALAGLALAIAGAALVRAAAARRR